MLKEIRKEGVALNHVTFNLLLSAITFTGSLSDIDHVIDEMRKEGLAPNRSTFNALMDTYSRRGAIDGVTRTLQHMTDEGLEPDDFNYTAQFMGYCRAGDIERAGVVLEEMRCKEMQPTINTFLELLKAHIRAGSKAAACIIAEEMHAQGFPLDAAKLVSSLKAEPPWFYSGSGFDERKELCFDIIQLFSSLGDAEWMPAKKKLRKPRRKSVEDRPSLDTQGFHKARRASLAGTGLLKQMYTKGGNSVAQNPRRTSVNIW